VLFFDDRLGGGFFIGASLIISAGLIVWAHEYLLSDRAGKRLKQD
jgi:hypothetical protein